MKDTSPPDQLQDRTSAEIVERRVPSRLAGERLDSCAADLFGDFSRSRLAALIREGMLTVNGKKLKPSYSAVEGDLLRLAVPPPKPAEPQPQDLPLEILYEDADIVAVAKPAGLVVHPAAGHDDGTLVNALLHHVTELSGIGGELRPGIVHRLDRDTSGVMVATKNDRAHRKLSRHFAERRVEKTYLAIAYGRPREDKGRISTLFDRNPRDRKKFSGKVSAGKPATTDYEVLACNGGVSAMRVRPLTGRTHQIRVHLAENFCPIVGDTMYGAVRRSKSVTGKALQQACHEMQRQALHAYSLKIVHPTSGKHLLFKAPIPDDMLVLLRLIDPDADFENKLAGE